MVFYINLYFFFAVQKKAAITDCIITHYGKEIIHHGYQVQSPPKKI